MPFQPVPNTAIGTLVFGYGDAPAREYEVSTYWVRDDGWGGSEAQALADALQGQFDSGDGLQGYIPDESMGDGRLIRTYARDLSNEFAVGAENTTGFLGEDTLPYAPASVAVWTRFNGTSGFPPKHGGMFWPFVREQEVDPKGLLSSFYTTTFLGVWNAYIAFIEALTPLDATHVIVSRNSKTAWVAAHPGATDAEIAAAEPWPRADNALVNTIASTTVRTLVGSQRDRRG